jgi:hypothetical protein
MQTPSSSGTEGFREHSSCTRGGAARCNPSAGPSKLLSTQLPIEILLVLCDEGIHKILVTSTFGWNVVWY